MTGRQNLRMTGAMNGLSGDYLEARIDELTARVGMVEAIDRKAGTYSKGMKQRLGIADILMRIRMCSSWMSPPTASTRKVCTN